MKFSLVTSTIGRTVELEKLMESLVSQTYKDFELFIIDQNSDDRIKPIIDKFSAFLSIRHLRSGKGLSRGRNIGLDMIDGDIVCFPDDDCEYTERLLEQVHLFFEDQPDYSFISTKVVDRTTGKGVGIRWKDNGVRIGYLNMFDTFSSVSIFIRTKAIGKIRFDEKFGAGATFGSSEETDFIYQLIKKKEKGYYEPALKVIHPDFQTQDIDLLKKRTYNYALGFGAFFKKQLLCNFSLMMFLNAVKYLILGPIIGFLMRLGNKKEIVLKIIAVKGMWAGFFRYKG